MTNTQGSTETLNVGKDLFEGLDSLIGISKGEIEINDNGPVINPTDTKLAEKKKEESSANIIDEEGMIDVDIDSKETTKSVNASPNKEIKNDTDTTVEVEGKAEDTEEITEETQKADALKSFALALKKEGVFTTLDTEKYDGSIEGLKNAIFDEAKVLNEDYKNSFPPLIKYLADNYEEGVPLDELIDIKSNEIRYSSIDKEKLKEDVGLQKAVYTEYLRKTTNFSDAKIAKEVTKLEDLSELDVEVEEALPELIKFEQKKETELKEKTKAEQLELKKRNDEVLVSIKKTTEDFKGKEIVPGIKLTDKDVASLYKSMTTPVGYDVNGSPISEVQKMRSEDPIGFELRLAHVAKLTKGFTDFSSLVKGANTVAAKKVEQAISTTGFKGGKSTIVEDDSTKSILGAASKYLAKLKK
jgi:hypothetical protein